MKPLSFWKKSFYSALVFFGTLIVLSIGYATYTTMTPAVSGQPITIGIWNTMIANIDDLNTRVNSFIASPSVPWSGVTSKPTTIAGYGITDSAPLSHANDTTWGVHGATTANTANMIVRRNASGNFSAGTITANLSGNATTATTATNASNVPWSGVSGKPTTIAGYGITDANAGFSNLLSANGYQKFPGGLILQWGTYPPTSMTHGTSYTVTFPIPFTAVLNVINTSSNTIGTTTTVTYVPITAITNAGFTFQYGSISGGTYTTSARWIAIGY